MQWHLNPLTTPIDPEERVKLWLMMLEEVKNDLKSGKLKEWAICSDSSEGFAISEGDEAMLHTTILRYVPYIIFSIKPVLTVDQTIDSIKRAVAAAKPK
jgi:hypothetical protein